MKFLICKAYKVLIIILLTINIQKCESLQEGQPNVCKGVKQSTNIQGGIVEVIDYFCCSGFKEEDDRCIECVECTKEESCPQGFCGKRCTHRCTECPQWTFCHPEQCCICPTGYTGHYCNQTCDQGYFGLNCTRPCKCSEHSSCDGVSGKCTCDSGWTGQQCEEEVELNNTLCMTDCECFNSGCNPHTGECQCPSENSTVYTVSTDLGRRHNSNNVFIFIILFAVALAALSMLFVSISIVIVVKKSKSIHLRPDQADTILPGQYDEINPYSEISPDDLVELRHPYYSSPLEVETLKKARSLPVIQLTDNFPETIKGREKEIPVYLSLPNLSEYSFILNPYISLDKARHNRRYDSLKIKSGRFKGSNYLHPYNALIKAEVNSSGYLHPYSSIETRHINTSDKSDSCDKKLLDKPKDNSYLTVIK